MVYQGFRVRGLAGRAAKGRKGCGGGVGFEGWGSGFGVFGWKGWGVRVRVWSTVSCFVIRVQLLDFRSGLHNCLAGLS